MKMGDIATCGYWTIARLTRQKKTWCPACKKSVWTLKQQVAEQKKHEVEVAEAHARYWETPVWIRELPRYSVKRGKRVPDDQGPYVLYDDVSTQWHI